MFAAVRAAEGRPTRRLRTFREAFGERFRSSVTQAGKLQFTDLVRYADDPIGFMHHVIGCTTWDKQDEMLLAVRDHERVSVRASQKASKDHTAAALALWWICTRVEGRCIFTSPTWRQCQQILYRQLKQHVAAVRKRYPGLLDCLRVAELCDTGIQTSDYTDLRSINGFVAHDTGGMQGISAPTGKLLVIIDEASHVADEIYLALDANLAAGGKMFVISNPLKSHSWFFHTHNRDAAYWHRLHIAAVMNPNYIQRRTVIPGLASFEYVERKRIEWGEASEKFQTRIMGNFATSEEARMFPHDRVQEAIDRWDDTPADGLLTIGFDPAGASERADESALAFVRGSKLIDLQTTRSLDIEPLVEWLVAAADRWRQSGEVPELRFDSEGAIGAQMLGTLRAYAKQHPHSFRLVPISSSDAPLSRRKKAFANRRDELADCLEQWLKTGAIIDDPLLLEDLAVMEWTADHKGRNKLLSKQELKKILGRSPDRYDALALACWQSGSTDQRAAMQRQAARQQQSQGQQPGSSRGGDRAWRQKSSTGRGWYGR